MPSRFGAESGYSDVMRSILIALILLQTSAAFAQVDPQPAHSVAYQSITAVRINPLGLVNFTRVSYRFRLFESESDILKQNYVGIGATGGISPAWGRIGILAEVQPLTILRLYAQYEFIGNFGTFDLFASFPSANADFSDSTIGSRAENDATAAYTTTGSLLTLGATLQLKVGPIAVRSLFRAARTNYTTRAGDVVYYDQIYDMLMPDDGWMVVNDLDVFAILNPGTTQLAAGVRWSYSHSFYNESHFTGPADQAAAADVNNDIHRLGPIVAWQIKNNPGARFDRPTLILLAQWHLRHRWRAGADVSQALPYIGLAFRFQGDLLGD